MTKLKLHTPDFTEANIAKLAEIFPHCVTETTDNNGEPKRAIDFDLLKQELSSSMVEGTQERYQLNWVGKKEALLTANAPIAKTLRPNRAESVNFDTTQNLYIEGDNLDALKLLQETYLNQVKMIYIDPPYNTGNDFIYEDDFAEDTADYLQRSNQKDEDGNRLIANTESNGRFHSDWLSMMYSRLRLARNLLKDDGVIAIHIDEHEYSNLEKMACEIFGEINNLGTIIWDKRNPKGDAKGIAYQHEQIIFFTKDISIFSEKCSFMRPKANAKKILLKVAQLIKKAGGVTENIRSEYKEWLRNQDFSGGEKAYSFIDDNGDVYRPVSMAWPNKKKAPDDYFIPLVHPITGKKCPVPERGWRNPSLTMKKLQANDLILFGSDETTQPNRKYLLKENLDEKIPSLLYFGGSDDDLLNQLGIYFDNPKVVEVAKKLIQPIANKKDNIVLDFFSGSATTAHAVMQLNAEDGGKRKFIMVQIPEPCDEKSEAYKAGFATIADIGKERIRRAGQKIKTENADKEGIDQLDIGFRVLKIDSSNMNEVYYSPDQTNQQDLLNLVDNIRADRSDEDLLFQILLDWGVDLTLPIVEKTIDEKTVFTVADNEIVACFDRQGGITEDFIKQLTASQPKRVVFCDSGFADDSVKINVEQVFKSLSAHTGIKTI